MEEYSPEVLRKLLVEVAGEVAGYLRDIAGTEGLDEVLRIGAGGDQTRKADMIAESLAVELLKKEHMPVRIVTEESGVIDVHNNPTYVVVMDPLDGSMNYVSLIPFAAVAMAVAPLDKPLFSHIIAGAIANIFLKEIYSFSDKGLFLDNVGYRGPGKSMGSIIVYTNNPNLFNVLKKFFKKKPGYRLRILGSASLELSYIGLGRISLFFNDSGSLRNVDIAPAAAFIKKAGYVVTDVYGSIIDFSLNGLHRIDNIVAGEKSLVNMFLSFLRESGYVSIA